MLNTGEFLELRSICLAGIESELNRVGLQVKTVVNLNATTAEDIGDGFINQRILAGGWLIEATRN